MFYARIIRNFDSVARLPADCPGNRNKFLRNRRNTQEIHSSSRSSAFSSECSFDLQDFPRFSDRSANKLPVLPSPYSWIPLDLNDHPWPFGNWTMNGDRGLGYDSRKAEQLSNSCVYTSFSPRVAIVEINRSKRAKNQPDCRQLATASSGQLTLNEPDTARFKHSNIKWVRSRSNLRQLIQYFRNRSR